MFNPSLVCGINVFLVQLQDVHDMQENVGQSRLFNLKKKRVSFTQELVL